MDKFILWSIISYGITTILVYGKIFNTLRANIKYFSKVEYKANVLNIIPLFFSFINELITCVLCTSTWVGFVLSFVLYSPVKDKFNLSYLNFFFDGVLSAGIVWIINSIIEFFEENRIKIDSNK
jgi:hypothetical protein